MSLLFIVWFLPAYLYRLSIKSTFWLYWPLAYVVSDTSDPRRPAVYLDKLSATPFAWFSFVIAAGTLIGFVAANINLPDAWRAAHVGTLIVAIEFVTKLDWSQKPWVWFNLVSASVSIGLLMWAGHVRPELKHGAVDEAIKASVGRQAYWMKRLAKVGRVCSVLLILSLLVYYVLLLSPLQCFLNERDLGYLVRLLGSYYGDYMPAGPSCGAG